MGQEESTEKVQLYMMVDGQAVEIATDIAEIKLPEGQQGNNNPELDNCEFSVKVKIMRPIRCRSRKRFVKLLMASGIDRNVAQVLARACVVWRNRRGIPACLKISYQGYFIDLWLHSLVKPGKVRRDGE